MREHGTEVQQVTEQVGVVYGPGSENIDGLQDRMQQVAVQLQDWVNETREKANTGAGGNILQRESYKDVHDAFGQMRVAKEIAAEDDTVASTLEILEGLMWQGVKWESEDLDTADLFNQMAAEHDLDGLVRKIGRDVSTISQVVLGMWWTKGTFKLRGETEKGNARKATREVWYPRRITVLDSTKVLPVGSLAFGMERLAWVPNPQEVELYRQHLASGGVDEVMDRFYTGWYRPTPAELIQLGNGGTTGLASSLGVKDVRQLILLAEDAVSRHTLTRADHERWAPIRLRSIFQLIDMKRHLMAADRVALVGAANYILLIKKGDKDRPGTQEEVDNLKENYRTLARIPVIFSDHRLSIEIVTPKQDFTLQPAKYDLIDERIIRRMLNALPGGGGRVDGTSKAGMGSWTARTLEGRRQMVKRYLERTIARAVFDHPNNADIFKDAKGGSPSLTFVPSRIVIDSDAAISQAIMNLRTQKELSRESALEYFGFDQATEAVRRKVEEVKYDDTFQTQVPFSAAGPGGPAPAGDGKPPAAQGPNGAKGGRPAGGGKPPANATKTRTSPSGQTSPSKE